MGTSDPARGLLLHLIGEAVEKLLRVGRILDRQNKTCEPEYRGVIDTFQAAISQFKKLLQDNTRVIQETLQGTKIEDFQRVAILTVLQNIVRSFYRIHELLVFLPREAVEREVLFVLEDCFGDEWRSRKASVILTSLYNAFEYRFIDVIKKVDVLEEKLPDISKIQSFNPESSILELAIVDRDNPLSWPILAHEFGHSLNRAYGVSTRIHGEQVKDLALPANFGPIVISWISEIFADLVAGRVMGPIAMLPLFSMEIGLSPILKGPSGATVTHPATAFRARMLRDYLKTRDLDTKAFEYLPDIYDEDQKQKLELLGTRGKITQRTEASLLEYVFNRLGPDIFSSVNQLKVADFSAASLQRAMRLQEKLPKIPISSLPVSEQDNVRERIVELKNRQSTRDEVYEALSELEEVPATSAEILTAGWLHKINSYPKNVESIFSIAPASFDDYFDDLVHLDGLLLKSLELSSVQGYLKKHAAF